MIYYPGRLDGEICQVCVLSAPELEAVASQLMELADETAVVLGGTAVVFVRCDAEAAQEHVLDATMERLGVEEVDDEDEDEDDDTIDAHGETVPEPPKRPAAGT